MSDGLEMKVEMKLFITVQIYGIENKDLHLIFLPVMNRYSNLESNAALC